MLYRAWFFSHGAMAAHALGYTQPITESEYKTLEQKGYKIRDRIGRTGVEAAYESHLRGKWGGQMLEVNAMGEVQRNLGGYSTTPLKRHLIRFPCRCVELLCGGT